MERELKIHGGNKHFKGNYYIVEEYKVLQAISRYKIM